MLVLSVPSIHVPRRPIHDRRKGWLRQTSVLLLCASLTAYFAYHAIRGKHGLEARSRLSERSMLLEREITSLEAARANLERDVALLGALRRAGPLVYCWQRPSFSSGWGLVSVRRPLPP